MRIFALLGLTLLGSAGPAVCDTLPPMLKPSVMSGVYRVGQSPSFTAPGGMTGLTWALYDWNRKPVATGIWPKEGPVTLAPLPKGYYYFQARNAEEGIRESTFCVVPDPQSRRYPMDSFYGVDAALSWVGGPQAFVLNWYGDNSYAATLDLIRLCGLPHVRERMNWPEISPQRGTYAWGRYAESVKFARERGIGLLGMFHDAPLYAGKNLRTPTDLGAVYEFCRDYGTMGKGVMSGWEFWNEPDITFWKDGAWNYVAAMKAAYLGYKAANPSAPVLNGSLCLARRGAFDRLLFRNDLAKYVNIFNFHLYNCPSGYPAFFQDLDAFLAEVGLDECERWLTESSYDIEGAGLCESLRSGCKAHSYCQEMLLAEMYPKSCAGLQMHGVGRNYFFVFGAYNERNGEKDWGVQRRDGSVKPLFAAVSTMTEHLVSARIVGEKNVGDGIRFFVFEQPDGTQSVAYWSVSQGELLALQMVVPNLEKVQRDLLERKFTITTTEGGYRGSNWCGTPFDVCTRNGSLELKATRYATFLDGFRGLTVDKPARPRGKSHNYIPAPDEDLTIVMRADLSPEDFDLVENKSVCEFKSGRKPGRMSLEIWNLSTVEKRGRVMIEGVEIAGDLPAELILPPWGFAKVECRIADIPAVDGTADMTITGVFAGRRTSRLVVPVRDMDRLLSKCEIVEVKANDPQCWKRNDSADEYAICRDEAENAVRFDFAWTNPKTDRWFYPVYMFKGDANKATLDDALFLEFEARLDQDKVENDIWCAFLMVLDSNGKAHNLNWKPPVSRDWQKIRIPLSDSNGRPAYNGSIGFRLGFNPRGRKVRFSLRNLRFIKQKHL